MARSVFRKSDWKEFVKRVVFPVCLSILLFIALIFAVLIPQQERLIIDRKKEMISELTASVWSVLAELEKKVKSGAISSRQARELAIFEIRNIRYGKEGKDYFWITDMHPNMIMHPYRSDLDGKDVTDYQETGGKKVFTEFVDVVRKSGEGYVEYYWQWKDDSARVVPKLSYVKGFQPWGWVVGTGVYLNDVREEMTALTRRLLLWTLGILAAITLLLLYGVKQSLNIERKRQEAEEELRNSEHKYRLLVESATEGLALILEGRFLYANKVLLQRLGYSKDEFVNMSLSALFADSKSAAENLIFPQEQFEVRIRTKSGDTFDAVISAATIPLFGKNGQSLTIRDVSGHKKIEEQLDQSRERYRSLVDKVGLGMFRVRPQNNWIFVDSNKSFLSIMRINGFEELKQCSLLDFVLDPKDRDELPRELIEYGSLKNLVVRVRRADSTTATLSLSIAISGNKESPDYFCEALVEDITDRKAAEVRQNKLREGVHSALLFDARPLRSIGRRPLTCPMNWTVSQAAQFMHDNDEEVAFVQGPAGESLGLITTSMLSSRGLTKENKSEMPCYEVMTAPVPALSENALLFEALRFLRTNRLSFLPLKAASGEITAVINLLDLLDAHWNSLPALLREFEDAKTESELLKVHASVPHLVKTLWESGTRLNHFTHLLTTISDAFTSRLITLFIARSGPPPVPFVFLAIGSEGRKEQTLVTDQDNLILYENPPSEVAEKAKEYFLALGKSVSHSLNAAGYSFCKGEIMASNPRWNLSLNQWKNNFSHWINEADPKALLDVNIFFDFRPVFGDFSLSTNLREYLNSSLKDRDAFFYNFASNILEYKPPLGMFGKSLNIKSALAPIVNFARLYSLHQNVEATNTIERLSLLKEKGILTSAGHREITDSYKCLMKLRLKHQTAQLEENRPLDNQVNLKTLTQLDLLRLKEALTQIQVCQARVRMDFVRAG